MPVDLCLFSFKLLSYSYSNSIADCCGPSEFVKCLCEVNDVVVIVGPNESRNEDVASRYPFDSFFSANAHLLIISVEISRAINGGILLKESFCVTESIT